MDLIDEMTDWCVACGTEHDYMGGPCENCGQHIFTKVKPAVNISLTRHEALTLKLVLNAWTDGKALLQTGKTIRSAKAIIQKVLEAE